MVELRLERDRVSIGADGDRPAWVVPRSIKAFDAEDRARIGAGPVTIVLMPDAVLDLALGSVVPATRAGVARALAGRTPLALGRACWGYVVEADGRVRVAMTHRDAVTALLRTLRAQGIAVERVLGGDIPLWTAAARVSPLWTLAAIPSLIALGAWGLAVAGEARVARMQPAVIARARDAAAGNRIAALFAGVPISTLLGRMEARLPTGVTLHAMGGTADGGVEGAIDAADPGVLRVALAGDPLLARLRTTGQQPVADRGIRVHVRMDGR